MEISESLYVGTKLICTKRTLWHNEGTAAINHQAYCCPHCGDIWARRIYAASGISFRFTERFCEQHGDGSLVFSDLEWGYLLEADQRPEHSRAIEAAYPLAWLAYELFLILRRSP